MSSASLMDLDQKQPETVEMESSTSQQENNCKWVDLVLDRKLLDSSFEGYKLSLDSFVQYKLELKNELKLDTHTFLESETKQKCFLYQHLKLYGLQNFIM